MTDIHSGTEKHPNIPTVLTKRKKERKNSGWSLHYSSFSEIPTQIWVWSLHRPLIQSQFN